MYIDAREYLEEIRMKRMTINNMTKALETLDYMIETSGISYNPDVVQSSPRQDGLERKAMAHLEKCAEIKTKMTEDMAWMYERISEATGYISRIKSDQQREVLMLRYIEGKRYWRDVLNERGFASEESQRKLCKRAINSLQKIMDDSLMAP